MSVRQFLVGDTMKISWINSGITPTAISARIYNGDETVVDSATMASSGDGHYYHLHTIPNSPGFYVAETLATIAGKPFKRRQKFQAVIEDVD